MSYLLRLNDRPAVFIGYRATNGEAVLSSIQLNARAEISVATIRGWYLSTVLTLFTAWCLSWICCKNPVLGIATLSKNNNVFKAQLPQQMPVDTFIRDKSLTRAWRSPQLLADDPDYFKELGLATMASPGTWDDHARVLFIELDFAKGRFVSIVCLLLLLAMSAGVVVGIVSNSIDAGTAIVGAGVAIVAVIAGFVFWFR